MSRDARCHEMSHSTEEAAGALLLQATEGANLPYVVGHSSQKRHAIYMAAAGRVPPRLLPIPDTSSCTANAELMMLTRLGKVQLHISPTSRSPPPLLPTALHHSPALSSAAKISGLYLGQYSVRMTGKAKFEKANAPGFGGEARQASNQIITRVKVR